ncbi:hypothetical protein AVEN_275605-1 [Araneus ventricosus]|uniref:Uncharacterized protein n=1 Tax=Araneus ventricosus TaxID=182803 RepID=A0A4Y2RJS9_ARAVE|nr:hypothetical protein AVEN_167498-1 [Araneus ventricosus]GBN73027.1 hypothetical protein AVEN_105120-1 [Araneus ventricosus]GBN76062.1 hypothetical protein AVEN_212280-1 [Araneus ventricosus]GBN76075.1 hypothetical protein AVEN_275605-1 [Araneus ventricosus]
MFRKILRTLLTGLSKVREIPRALHVPRALLDASCNAVATSSTDVEAIAFLPPPHFTSNEPVFSNLSTSSSDQMQLSDQSRFLNPLMSGISSMQFPHSHRSCKKASQAEPDLQRYLLRRRITGTACFSPFYHKCNVRCACHVF